MDEVTAILNYSKSIIGIEYEIAMLKEQMKDIRKEAKEDGVSTKMVNAALNKIKKELKTPVDERNEIQDMEDVIREDNGVMKVIHALVDS